MANRSLSDLVADLKSDQWHTRSRAAKALGQLEAGDAERAVPVLRDALHDAHREVRRDAVIALGKLGPIASEAVPDLIAAIRDPELRFEVPHSLRSIGAPAVPSLLAALGDSEIAIDIETTLRSMGEIAMDDLLAALAGEDLEVRSKVVPLICSIAPAGRQDAVDALVAVAQDTTRPRLDRFHACSGLEKLDPATAERIGVPSLQSQLFERD